MNSNYLDFEEPIAELDAKIDALKSVSSDQKIDVAKEMQRLEKKRQELTLSIFKSLTPWQITQIARHPQRPYTLDYISKIFTEFDELHGDRAFSDDRAMIGGTARLEGQPVMVIGHQKGRGTKEKIYHNFGMPNPEGYRKALRLMQMAERYRLPIITLIDTPGANPGIGAEERNQSEAIARNLAVMAGLKTPIVCTVIGEGGSGGALAIGVGDRVLMLENSVYSVISPEGCASILWRSVEKAPDAAKALKLTAQDALGLNLIDGIVPEPIGGVHRDIPQMMKTLKSSLLSKLNEIQSLDTATLLEKRYQRIRSYGQM